MSDAPYERYKEALRAGHVAALHGHLDAALAAYAEAASVAPDRALPLTSRAAVLVRLERLDEALEAYGAALSLAPRDEAALGGRADALVRAGRPAEAAGALDLLAEIQAVSGRLPDACDTARRALELAESKARRRHLSDLTELVRDDPGGAASEALARAMRLLEEPVRVLVPQPAPSEDGQAPDESPDGSPGAATPDAGPAPRTAPVRPIVIDVAAVSARLEAAMAADDSPGRIGQIVSASRELAAAGLDEAALDAADSALGFAPDDPDLHLVLVELYVARGWRQLAGDKLLLLGRLVELSGDAAVRDRLCAAATRLLPDDSRLAGLCA
jgi:tetratricopeptide (TPR) repeat protein